MTNQRFPAWRATALPALCLTALIAALSLPAAVRAQEAVDDRGDATPSIERAPGVEAFAMHAQATTVWQVKPGFSSPYSGTNSLGAAGARSYSFTSTMDLGWSPWEGTELHFNPEGAMGLPFSDLHGLGGMSNGELAKTSGTTLAGYVARAFLRQTWGLGGGRQKVDADMNQLAGYVDNRRVVVTAGIISLLDIFDGLSVSHDPRTQFLNWSFMTYGSFDYAADARGYTRGAAIEYIDDVAGWAVRYGRFAQPIESNGLPLDMNLADHYGDQIEFEKSYTAWGRPGTARLLVFRNQARMGSFADAIAYARVNGGTPDVANVRKEQGKMGLGIDIEQALTGDVTFFTRLNFADGRTETYSFTEIDRSVSAGVVVAGHAWGRPHDTAGFAFALNGLSASHRQYLSLGGLGAFLGDGALNYGTERILEGYYSWQPVKRLWLTGDLQYIENPGYNRDRGPATILGARLHFEF